MNCGWWAFVGVLVLCAFILRWLLKPSRAWYDYLMEEDN